MPPEKIKVSCVRCGTTNYFPLGAEGKKVLCGRCRTPLPPPGSVLEPDMQGISNLLEHSSLPVLVDFYSPTCGPCHMMHPVVERLGSRRAGEVAVIKVNVDDNPEVARRFGIQAVPTFLVVLKGIERGRTSGAMSEENFSFWVASKA